MVKVGNKNNHLFLTTVKHSQSVSFPPLKVCVIKNKMERGNHCTLHLYGRTGWGMFTRSCSIVCCWGKLIDQISMSLLCSWLPPTFQSVKFSEINAIDFATPQHKRKLSSSDESASKSNAILPPTEEQLKRHYSKIAQTNGKPSLLSLVSGMNQSFVPKYVSGELPKPLTYLYDKEALSLSFSDLLEKCEDI